MIDRLQAMSVFVAIAEAGSFTAAARRLRLPLATVSRRLGELERHLGAQLLIRTTRRLALSPAGKAYLVSARRILEAVEASERTAAGEYTAPRGQLTLTGPVVFGRHYLLPIVTAFLEAFPEVDVRLLLSDRNLHLVEDHVDMALRIGRLPDSGLIATRVGQMRQVICASPGFLAARGVPRTPDDLSTLPCVTFDFGGPTAAWLLRAPAGGLVEVPVRSRLSASTADAAAWAAEQGVGASRLMHYQCAEAVAQGRLQLLLESFEPDPQPVSLLHAPAEILPLKTRLFLDFAAPRLREALKALAAEGAGTLQRASKRDGPGAPSTTQS